VSVTSATTAGFEQMLTDASSILELNDVSLFRGDRVILKDLTWQVQRGDHWAVVGANGSGKTMMLKIATGYLWPSQGTVKVLGNRFGTIDLRELRTQIGWISAALRDLIPPQDSALDVILSGRFASLGLWNSVDDHDKKRALELLSLFNCDNVTTQSFGSLSQGEQQKILIARALLPTPRLLILDEPCSGLDLSAREQLLQTITQVGRQSTGPTLIFVTHHIEEITPIFTHALIMQSGRIVAQGVKEQVLTTPILSQAFGVPVNVIQTNGRYYNHINEC
jgi:iron complex transport system ATP-binding protein